MAKSMTLEELQAEIARVQAENDALKAAQRRAAMRGLSARVSAKGALSVYGLGRFPVTLYRGQWERLAAWIGEGSLQDAIIIHGDALATKGEDS